MPIPGFQTMMLPLLQYMADGKEHSNREALDALADQFELSDEERKELLPSGQDFVFRNRLAWARTHVKAAGLIDSSKRGIYVITKTGMDLLTRQPEAINLRLLQTFEAYREFRIRHKSDKKIIGRKGKGEEETKTPEEQLEEAYGILRDNLINQILEQLKGSSASFFEKVVVEVLVKMGYGGSRKDAGQAIGKTGDEGIDGIIKEDRLGLDIIYIQAKKWEDPISRPEIQKFAGALQGKRARKGVFITTSRLCNTAVQFVDGIDSKIILIDGRQLAQYMIDFNVGVTAEAVYELKKIDSDYYTDN